MNLVMKPLWLLLLAFMSFFWAMNAQAMPCHENSSGFEPLVKVSLGEAKAPSTKSRLVNYSPAHDCCDSDNPKATNNLTPHFLTCACGDNCQCGVICHLSSLSMLQHILSTPPVMPIQLVMLNPMPVALNATSLSPEKRPPKQS